MTCPFTATTIPPLSSAARLAETAIDSGSTPRTIRFIMPGFSSSLLTAPAFKANPRMRRSPLLPVPAWRSMTAMVARPSDSYLLTVFKGEVLD